MSSKVLVVLAGALLMSSIRPAQADTHAPNLQILDFTCDGQVMTFVSPNFSAKAGQDLGSTSVGVTFQITLTATGEILYQSPAFSHFQAGLLTTCTATEPTLGNLTFWFLLPPLEQ